MNQSIADGPRLGARSRRRLDMQSAGAVEQRQASSSTDVAVHGAFRGFRVTPSSVTVS